MRSISTAETAEQNDVRTSLHEDLTSWLKTSSVQRLLDRPTSESTECEGLIV